MDANRRNYYGECAAYIAALGEVRESMGEMGIVVWFIFLSLKILASAISAKTPFIQQIVVALVHRK